MKTFFNYKIVLLAGFTGLLFSCKNNNSTTPEEGSGYSNETETQQTTDTMATATDTTHVTDPAESGQDANGTGAEGTGTSGTGTDGTGTGGSSGSGSGTDNAK